MTVPAPTAADLKTRFPIFAGVDNAVVTSALVEAARLVDGSWTDGDFALAQMLYACHVMTLDGLGSGAEAELLLDMPLGVSSLQAGGSKITRAAADADGSATGFSATSFGQRFAVLMRRNIGGPRSTSDYPNSLPVGFPWGYPGCGW